MTLHIFGIRHHGPGCARSLRAALEELQPDVVVMEGPADAESVLPLAAHEEMKPPVALLIYPPDEPSRAAYFPMTVFSPEWQTLRWAAAARVPVKLMDLPQTHQLAMWNEREAAEPKERRTEDDSAAEADSPEQQAAEPSWRTDPLALLAEAAGYRDHELWWEEQIERRTDATGLFAAILEAMRTVREEIDESREWDLLREAFMRKILRKVIKEPFQKVAAVCGAWHAPVLDQDALTGKRSGLRAKDDNERLKKLPKLKTSCTWIPWTYSRLTYRSGYGAGVESPGWYDHLWTSNDKAPTRWVATAARLLREKDLDASSAGVIEAVRLADALAALRELRSPGLRELNEAIQTVLCRGDASPMHLIHRRLSVGDVLGEVPKQTPSVPLAQDLARLQKSLRLKPSTENRLIDLDLRKDNDLARSRLLHKLNLLGIPWGSVEATGGRASTFHEVWRIEWRPEFAVAIIEANVWGNTIASAATAKAVHDAADAPELPSVTAMLNTCILAGLADAVDPILERIQAMAAVGADVRHLMDSLPPLARVARYGDVRGTRAHHVEPILVGMFERALVGLASACSSLDDEAAARMLNNIGRVGEALQVLNRDDLTLEWQQQLRRLMQRDVHALLRGWCCRLLLEQRALAPDELARMARLALSPANPPAECAAWATGLLRGSGLVLLHQDQIWPVFDRWLSELHDETFLELLPLLRRAFADFSGPERRQMGEKVKHLGPDDTTRRSKPQTSDAPPNVNLERARRALPVLAQILGVDYDANHHE